jgi:hypothetical protein
MILRHLKKHHRYMMITTSTPARMTYCRKVWLAFKRENLHEQVTFSSRLVLREDSSFGFTGSTWYINTCLLGSNPADSDKASEKKAVQTWNKLDSMPLKAIE